jgi:hypothetical protein
MRRHLLSLLAALLLSWPALAFAEEAVGGSYRGIATIYYRRMWGVLWYGLYDAVGKKAFYVGAPILAVAIYLILPPA